MLGAIGFRPDVGRIGDKQGAQPRDRIVYSGTCAAAREAVLAGIPGIAVSCASRSERLRYGAAASFVLDNLEGLAAACSGRCLRQCQRAERRRHSTGAEWSYPCARIYGNALKSFAGPDGFDYCFLTGSDFGARGDARTTTPS